MTSGSLLLDALLVVIGAAAGAVTRLLFGWIWTHIAPGGFPWAIWVVNMVGAFAAGLLAGTASSPVFLLAGIGFCGSLTTMSTFALDSVALAEEGLPRVAWANVLGSVIPGVALALLGLWWSGAL